MLVRSFVLSLVSVTSLALAGCGSSDSGAAAAPGGTGGTAAAGAGGAGGEGGSGVGGTAAAGDGGSAGMASAGMAGASAEGPGGSGTAGTSTAGAGGTDMGAGGFHTAQHANPPIVAKYGGPVLKNPQVVTVTYSGFKYQADVEKYGDWLVTSDWMTAWGAEYGVGAGTHLAKVELPDAAPTAINDDTFQQFLVDKLTDGTLPAPAGNPNDYIYMFYLPKGTKYTQADGSVSCKAFGGFHNGLSLQNYRVAYAIIVDCGGGLPDMEITASHELAEAASDPLPYNNPAYKTAPSLSPWVLIGGEIGDWCEDLPDTGLKDPTTGYYTQRIWSNAAAKASADPCVPAAAGPMFNVSPSASTFVSAQAGGSIDINLVGWSSEEMPDWTVKAQTSVYSEIALTTTLSAKTINNGQTVTATIKVPASAPAASFGAVSIYSTYQGRTHEWVIGVNTPQ